MGDEIIERTKEVLFGAAIIGLCTALTCFGFYLDYKWTEYKMERICPHDD